MSDGRWGVRSDDDHRPVLDVVRSGEAAGREPGEAAERIGALLRSDGQTVTEP
ncbi:hypothetical protein Acsp07_32420 [Actinomycetospora sp. NBRC 106378]|nr:hypothetical protein Acsp07_32420 [Actinomycetospora sp. NBRC 106378]